MESLDDLLNVLLDALDATARPVLHRNLDVAELKRALRALAHDDAALRAALRLEVR